VNCGIEFNIAFSAIQNDRDRIGYTKRTKRPRRSADEAPTGNESFADAAQSSPGSSVGSPPSAPMPMSGTPDPLLERLTDMENKFTLLFSRALIDPYASLDEALAAPSRFCQPLDVQVSFILLLVLSSLQKKLI
jgi:hypothetical protein